MLRIEGLSIKQKLMTLSLLASGTALVFARMAFLSYDFITFRSAMVRSLSTQAEIVGFNSTSALLFHDSSSAVQTLSALKARDNIVLAGIYDQDRHPFAIWKSDKSSPQTLPVLSVNGNDLHRFTRNSLELFHPIIFEGTPVGTVYIRSNLRDLKSRFINDAFITVGVLFVSFLVAVLISIKLGNKISEPILDLVEAARTVSANKDYSVRAKNKSRDEIGLLVDTFNTMLTEIQASGEELRKSHEELEQRVQERTSQLEVANKELETFSYSVSHDLRAPLRTIDGFSLALLEDCGDMLNAQGREHLQRIRTGSQHMAQLIDDMLNLSRITRGALNRQEVDLSALGQILAVELKKNQPDRRVTFDIAAGMVAQADSRLLRIALENLFSNAWKFTSKQPEAEIEFDSLSGINGEIVYYVRDNGAGFDMAYVGKLFGPFQRLHSVADFGGTGVGLATVQRVVSRHGGRIWAEGAVGKGATFYFTL